jgi:phage gp29-like protein
MSMMVFEEDKGPAVPAVTVEDVNSIPRDEDFGRFQWPSRRPDTRTVFTARVKDRLSNYNATIKPEEIVAAFREAEDGNLKSQNDLFERMEEQDMALSGFMATRRLAPVGLKYTIVPKITQGDGAEEAKKAAEFVSDVLRDIPDFRGALLDMCDAIGKSISMLEVDWLVTPDRVWVGGLRHIDPKRYLYDKDSHRLLIRTDEEDDYTLTGPETPKAIIPPPFKVVAHRSKMRSGHPARGGALRVVALGFLIRNFGYKDWSTYGEVFGMPLRVGKYPAGTGEPEKLALLEAVRALGSDAAAIISQQTELEIKDSIDRGVEPYSALISAMRTEMAIAILGQEMTNNAPSQTGARAAAQVQQMVRQDLLEADCEQLSNTIKRDLIAPILGFNLGWEWARRWCPQFVLHYQPPADLKTLIEIDRVLFAPKAKGGLGLPITKKQLYERYSIEPPPQDAKPEDMLVQPEDELPPTAAGNVGRNQDGENHDSRANADRRVDRTRAGSNAAKTD